MNDRSAPRAEATAPIPFGDTVTILFSDIRGFTEYTDEHGDEAAYRMLTHHNNLVREQFEFYGGHIVKSQGDSFMVTFGGARAAITCAAAIQRALDRHNRGRAGSGIHVGIGINLGEPVRDSGDFFGSTVNLASRLCAAAGPGQILVSEAVHLVAGKLEGLPRLDRGLLALKGFREPQRTYEVDWWSSVGARRPAPLLPAPEAPAGRPGRRERHVRDGALLGRPDRLDQEAGPPAAARRRCGRRSRLVIMAVVVLLLAGSGAGAWRERIAGLLGLSPTGAGVPAPTGPSPRPTGVQSRPVSSQTAPPTVNPAPTPPNGGQPEPTPADGHTTGGPPEGPATPEPTVAVAPTPPGPSSGSRPSAPTPQPARPTAPPTPTSTPEPLRPGSLLPPGIAGTVVPGGGPPLGPNPGGRQPGERLPGR